MASRMTADEAIRWLQRLTAPRPRPRTPRGPVAVPEPDRYRAGKRLWSAADDALLRELYPDTPNAELTTRFRRTVNSIYARADILKLHKSAAYMASPHACRLRRGDNVGAAFRYPKGHVPANKGLRRPGWAPGRMGVTQFKKGQLPRNNMPVGSTRLIEGYVYRKVSAVPYVPYTVNWKPEHVLVWERAHGPIPAGHAVKFKNGDRQDIRLDNLQLLSRRELMLLNSVHNLPAPLPQTIQLLGALRRQIRRQADGKTQDRRSA